jgi:hypothetical protein
VTQPQRPFGIASLRRLLTRREHQAFLDELLIAMEDSDPSSVDFLQALGGEGLVLLLRGEPTRVLLNAYTELLLAGSIQAPPEIVQELHERFPSPGLEAMVRAKVADEARVESRQSAISPATPAIQLKRVIQIIDMGFGTYPASDADGIRRSVFRSEQERTFLQALALRFPALHAFPNYPLDQLADFEKLKNLLDDETLQFGRRCRVDAVLVVPGEGDPVAAFELDSDLHDDPAQARRDRLRNRLFRAIRIPFFRLRAEQCTSVGVDEWYALLTDEVADKIDCGRRVRIRAKHPMLVPT